MPDASMRPRPRPRKTLRFRHPASFAVARFNEAAAAAAENEGSADASFFFLSRFNEAAAAAAENVHDLYISLSHSNQLQ